MKRFMNKKLLVVGVAVALVLGIGGGAFAYFTSQGAGTGSAQVGTTSPFLINQLGTTVYNSTIGLPDYQWSQAFNGPQITQFGNKVTLAASSAPLNNVTVAMTMCDGGCGGVNASVIPSYTTPVTVNIYSVAAGGGLGTLLTSDTKTVTVPAVPVNTAAVPFNVGFNDFTPAGVVLPSSIIYGITLDQLVTDGTTGNDSNPVGSLNVNLSTESTDVSVGADTDPGNIFVSSAQADSGSALASNLGDCPGAPSGVLTAFQEVPVDCTAGYSLNPSGGLPSLIPAVQINVSGLGDLYPGGPALPINFSVYNPGSSSAALNTVTIKVAYDPSGNIEQVAGDPSTALDGCLASWFTVSPATLTINGSLSPGQTWDDSPSGATISMPSDSVDNQDICEGATVGLLFTSS
jgi:hypothetical protein